MNFPAPVLGVALACASPAFAQCLTADLPNPSAAVADFYGRAVDLDGDRALIGAPQIFSSQPGKAAVHRRAPTGWTLEAELVPPGGGSLDLFGLAVALDGDVAVVGAPSFGVSGAAYVFHFGAPPTGTEPAWSLAQTLLPPPGSANAHFGYSVAIDGGAIAVGAYGDDTEDLDAGAVFVYRDALGTWFLDHAITTSAAGAGDRMGQTVALSGDFLLAGAPGNDDQGTEAGAVFAFRYNFGTDTWLLEDKLTAPDAAAGDNFGDAVAFDSQPIVPSFPRAVVGAPEKFVGGVRTGAAYVFGRTTTPLPFIHDWAALATLLPADVDADQRFGQAVDLARDRAAVGAFRNDTAAEQAGAVSLFTHDPASDTWSHELLLHSTTPGTFNHFGRGVALADDALVIGESGADPAGNNSGHARFYDVSSPCPALLGSVEALSASAGGLQDLHLFAGPEHAGKIYWLLGSVSGTAPGTGLLGAALPLNTDPYFNFTLTQPSVPPLVHSIGTLDAPGGVDLAGFLAPPNTPQNFVGTTFHHAYLVLGTTSGTVDFVSEAVPVTIVP